MLRSQTPQGFIREKLYKTFNEQDFQRLKTQPEPIFVPEEVAENEEDTLMHDIFLHIKSINPTSENFARIKHMFKYPFRSIDDKFQAKESHEVDLSFDYFRNFYRRLLKAHAKCGKGCVHLKRFYQKIGFNIHPQRKEILMGKRVIDKLPKIPDF